MGRRTILLDTLTRHFITFAKTMGIFPRIVLRFKERAKWEELDFYEKGSFYEYIRRGLECRGYTSRVLNEYSIRSIYFEDLLPPSKSNYKKYTDSINESEMLLELFMSYLKDRKIPRYIKIIIN
jgi:hypothetical protein